MKLFKKIILFLFFCLFSIIYTKNGWENINRLINRRKIRLILKNGFIVNLSNNYYKAAVIIFEIFIQRVYNPSGLEINDGDVVVDVGGNIGLFTLFASAFTKNKIVVCEPFLNCLPFLKENLIDNKLKKVTIEPVAVAGKIQVRKLYVSPKENNSSFVPIGKNVAYLKVKTNTLARIIHRNHIKKIGFLKMDCEGAEGEIIKFASFNVLKKINKIALEYHDNTSILNHDEIKIKLEKAGFQVFIKNKYASSIWWPYFGYLYAVR